MVNQRAFDTLRLIRSKGLDVKMFYKLIRIYKTPEKALENLTVYTRRNPVAPYPKEFAEQEIEHCRKIGAEIVSVFDESYPYNLKQIIDAPPILTLRGNKKLLRNNSIAIVGARNASAHGYNFAYRTANELGKAGFVIVSGLARGIDTAVHRGSVETGTIAVIAGGIDNIYPRENEGLYKIIARNGLIISEFPFGAFPRGQHFPARNRIISGLSKAVVIIEAGLRSGTLITANTALEQDREVFVAPGNPCDPRCEGSNQLLKDGATLITRAEDILDSIGDCQIPTKLQLEYRLSQNEPQADLFDEKTLGVVPEKDVGDKNKRDGKKQKPSTKTRSAPKSTKERILEKLSSLPISVNLLNEQLELDIAEYNRVITELELEGSIVVECGGIRKVED